MKTWNLSDNNPFIVGEESFISINNNYVKVSNTSILFCIGGNAQIEINLIKYEIAKNSQILLLPGSIFHFNDISADFKMIFIGCYNNFFHEVTNCLEPNFFHFLKEVPCVTLEGEELDYIKSMLFNIDKVYKDKNNRYRVQICRNFIQNILFHFYDKTQHLFEANNNKWPNRKEELFKKFVQLVNLHCCSRRDVGFFAQELNITPRYLSTIVQTVAKETAKEIIDSHAIVEIKILLKNSNLSIKEISSKMKFVDQSFFGQYFKKNTGMSPVQYRNEN
ncbi:MAG: helix-turn-helix domain-containing protein [Bacteroidales bacterium]|nr:helix-turn-helix domain-containing protein [Bacteroidales bacterium]